MSRKRYPQSEYRSWLIVGAPRECECCEKPATHLVSVRWGPFRGDDIGDHAVCERHLQMYRTGSNFERFIGHLRTKERFVKAKAQIA